MKRPTLVNNAESTDDGGLGEVAALWPQLTAATQNAIVVLVRSANTKLEAMN